MDRNERSKESGVERPLLRTVGAASHLTVVWKVYKEPEERQHFKRNHGPEFVKKLF